MPLPFIPLISKYLSVTLQVRRTTPLKFVNFLSTNKRIFESYFADKIFL